MNRPCSAPDWDIPAADTTAFHVVRRDDTLTRIARRHGASIDTLRRANDLTSSLIFSGQALRVPLGATLGSPSRHRIRQRAACLFLGGRPGSLSTLPKATDPSMRVPSTVPLNCSVIGPTCVSGTW